MGDRRHKRRRVFVEDSRHNGGYLRATWHPERRIFTISTWTGEVCTGAVRVPAVQAPELVALVVDGLAEPAVQADAVAAPGAVPASDRPRPSAASGPGAAVGTGLRSVLDAARRWVHARTATPAAPLALRQPPSSSPARGPVDRPVPDAAGEQTA